MPFGRLARCDAPPRGGVGQTAHPRLTMSAPFAIWHLDPSRAAEWREIRLEALLTEPDAYGSRYDDWRDEPLSFFAQRLTRVETWAAGDAVGMPLAVAGWEADQRANTGWVLSVYTRPAARGRGLMSALFDQLMARARAAGLSQMALNVGQGNIAAQRTYARLGFAQSAPAVPNELGVPEFEMRRPL
ncbi:MAG: hypothetical protein DI498_06285 [Paracoccus denitrificans]|nr:MAG: hypothetical protein DI498_06285 [Paracoccus denitrificans]PZO84705.1 MAG: hypothetical protein DI633_06285 [Paracoccus denitrificans]